MNLNSITASQKSPEPVVVPVTTERVVATPSSPAVKPVDEAQLKHSVEAINRFLQPVSSDIEFSVDHESGRTLVKIVDTQTQTLLRQIPTQEVLDIARELDRLQGLLLRDKA